MRTLDAAGLLVRIALRSLLAHKVKSSIVGGILFFGTFLMVLGLSVMTSIERAMEGSITSSLAGQYQVYDANAKDPLELYGGFGGGLPDLGEVPDFARVDATLNAVPNVRSVVPMGLLNATVFARTELDQALEGMREAVTSGDLDAARALVPQVRRIATSYRGDQDNRLALTSDREAVELDKAHLDQVLTDAFWAPFQPSADPMAPPDTAAMLAALDFLDTQIAPLASDGRLLYLRALGTDLDQFTKAFDRFYVVQGEMVPPGRRGLLLSNRTYERIIKNRVAREIDDIVTKVTDKGQTIAGDQLLREQVARNSRQYARVVFQLSPADAEALQGELATYLGDNSSDLDHLVEKFLMFTDENLLERRDWFYAHIAPKINLYDLPVGSTITLRSFTKSGYLKAVNVKVYGTYDFKGLEKADVFSASNLTDLVTFRELYGKMSDSTRAELDAIRASVGIQEVSAQDAEAALFGGSATVEVAAPTPEAPAEATPAPAEPEVAGAVIAAAESQERVYTTDEMREGLVLNAAILLDDPKQAAQTGLALQKAIDDSALGVKLIDWMTASGTTGQFIWVMKGVLYISFFIIFLVALIIVNNAMIMATMDRVGEIGTMRAIGAQRTVVVAMFLLETVVLGLLAGLLGAAAGAGMVSWLGHAGIPAPSEQLILLFAGPRLYPTWESFHLVFGLVTVMIVGILSTVYPAVLASRIQPIVAMQGKE